MQSSSMIEMRSPCSMLAAMLVIYLTMAIGSTPSEGRVSRRLMELHGLETYLVHSPTQGMPSSFPSQKLWQIALLRDVADQLLNIKVEQRLVYSYRHVIEGFAVLLTAQEAERMGLREEVTLVQKDEVAAKPQTTRTPAFLNLLSPALGDGPLWTASRRGQDVIIGILDSGVWPEHPSFSDSGGAYGPVPGRWKGQCESYPPSFIPSASCNLKLIGARAFFNGYESYEGPINETVEFRSPRDNVGHGTHTASTASGSTLLTATNSSFFGFAPGTPTGMAPTSRLAVYKVCWKPGCYSSDILAGFDAAISDGVDVISVSLGGSGSSPYYTDPIAVGSFAAARNGIATSCSAGNGGPAGGTVAHGAPWIFTVAASTIDRGFPASVALGNGEVYVGSSLYAGPGLNGQLPLIAARDAAINGSYLNGYYAQTCGNVSLLNTTLVSGKIVLCIGGGGISRVKKGIVVREAGGVGMILENTYGELTLADSHVLPALSIGAKAAAAILLYIRNTSNPTAAISNAVMRLGTTPAPAMAAFSSRGPSSGTAGILKPDITAPGVNILAAWSGAASPTGLEEDPRRAEFNIISGTSTSCPHVSGLMALLKAAHPEWSPAAIKSALMTTASIADNEGHRITDTYDGEVAYPTAYGSGHVNPNAALQPGLVYNISIQEYLDFVCGLNYSSADMLNIFTYIAQANCTGGGSITRPIDLNYPSFSIVVPSLKPFSLTTSRTLTNVGPPNSTYTVSINPPPLLDVFVIPSTLSFSSLYQNLSYSITFNLSRNYADFIELDYSFNTFGSLSWADGVHNVTSPISFLVSRNYR